MDMNIYPDFDVDAELKRAESSVAYHDSQAEYFRSQVKALRKAKAEQMEMQFVYDDDVPVINDDRFELSQARISRSWDVSPTEDREPLDFGM